jgi:hypothetical protein
MAFGQDKRFNLNRNINLRLDKRKEKNRKIKRKEKEISAFQPLFYCTGRKEKTIEEQKRM